MTGSQSVLHFRSQAPRGYCGAERETHSGDMANVDQELQVGWLAKQPLIAPGLHAKHYTLARSRAVTRRGKTSLTGAARPCPSPLLCANTATLSIISALRMLGDYTCIPTSLNNLRTVNLPHRGSLCNVKGFGPPFM